MLNSCKMKSIIMFLKNLKNLLPYLLLIAIYFFFVNLEARKDRNNNRNIRIETDLPDDKSSSVDRQLQIRIPVIPYKQ